MVRHGRARAMIATAGAGGAYLLARDGDGPPRHIPAVTPAAPVADSNGAGGAFLCGFLHGRMRGADFAFASCARLCATAGAYTCTARGNPTLVDAATLDCAQVSLSGS